MKKTFRYSFITIATLGSLIAMGNAQAQETTSPIMVTPPAVALGQVQVGSASATDNLNNLAVGAIAKAYSQWTVAVGKGAEAGLGVSDDMTGRTGYATAFGGKAIAYANHSTALGAQTNATGENSVALGYGSIASEANVVSIGTDAANGQRKLVNVAAGVNDYDAVNMKQFNAVKTNVDGLMNGTTQVSQIDLLADPGDPANGVAPTGIGLRFEAASSGSGQPGGVVAQAAGDGIGRLAYTDTDGTARSVATLSDGFMLRGGSGANAQEVSVALNQGITFEGDEYITTSVGQDATSGGAIVKLEASQSLKNSLAQLGVVPPTGDGSTGGSTGGSSAGQIASGNFSSKGITVAAGEGKQQITIGQNNVNMGGNRIQNVGDPIQAGDAANKAYVDRTARSLRDKIHDVDKDLRAGVAMAIAVAGLPQAYMPGKSVVSLAGGTYHGQGGFALGLSHATDNRSWVFKGAASVDTRGNFGGSLSAGYQF